MNDPDALSQGFLLEDLLIQPTTGEVAGAGGSEKLDPKVMGVLMLMARRAGQVVARAELLTELWPNSVVTDDSLTRCLYELRRQLSRAGGDKKYRSLIETLPKRGYRLVGTVAPLVPETAARSPWRLSGRRTAIARGTAVVVVGILVAAALLLRTFMSPATRPEEKSIAVLPFLDLSAGQDQQYLSDGITEEILDRLAKAGQLRVIARTSSFSFRNRPAKIPEIAAELNVSYILEGSVRQSGDRIRITAQLVQGADASHVWSETYDRRLGKLFEVQDEIASAVANALAVRLSGGGSQGQVPTSAAAYESFLLGEYFHNRRGPGDVERSLKHYQDAISQDPAYAKAWAALSGACSMMWWELGADPSVWRRRQGEAARRAVELDPNLAVARIRLASYYFDTSDRRRGIEQLQQAKLLDPDDPWLAEMASSYFSWSDDDIAQQIAVVRRGVERDPLSAVRHLNLGLLLFSAAHLDEAMAEFQTALELNPDMRWPSKIEVGRVLVAQERYAQADAAFMQLPSEGRDYGLALLHYAPGRHAEANAALERLKARSDYAHGILLAEAYAIRGLVDEAFDSLRRTRDTLERDESILIRLWFFQWDMKTSPFLKPLRDDPRWSRLMATPEGDSAQEIIENIWPGERDSLGFHRQSTQG